MPLPESPWERRTVNVARILEDSSSNKLVSLEGNVSEIICIGRDARRANPLAHAADRNVKIGFISAFTDVFSSFGQQQKEGAVLALEEANYTAGGD